HSATRVPTGHRLYVSRKPGSTRGNKNGPTVGIAPMITRIDTVIIGGGQAGLSVSYYLTQQRREHVVLEQADVPGNAWRNHRWDSFTLNTPNWQSQLPGAEHRGVDPDAFTTRAEIVAYFENYVRRFRLPVRYGKQVRRVERDPIRSKYYV